MKTKLTPFVETLSLDDSLLKDKRFELREVNGGYLVCQPRIARTGIQEYHGVELGRPDLERVRVYRPESEVFAHDAIKTLAGKPVTVEHPDGEVNASNWRELAVGYVGNDIMRDGEFIRIPLHLMDAKAIEEVKGGKTQLSVGYTAQLNWADGVTPDGEKYQVTQTAIRANHVAITHTARGGPLLRMGDNRRDTMATRTITVDSLPVTVEERDASLIERAIAKLATDLATAQTALAAAQTTAQNDTAKAATEVANIKTEVQTKDAEIATLKSQLADAKVTPKKLHAMAQARAATETRAKALLDSCICDDKTDEEIRRQVVSSKLGEIAKDWTDDMITASFNTLSVKVADDGNFGNGNGSLNHVVEVIRNTEGGGDQVSKAYRTYENDLSNRWKTAGVRNNA